LLELSLGSIVTSGWIFLISFIALAAGVVLGMILRNQLPKQHLDGAKEVVRLGAGFLATLSAVLISLMITSAKSSYDTQDSHFRTLAAYLVETDQLLVQYGPETLQIRILMRQAFPAAIDRIWREKRAGSQDSAFTSASLAEQISSVATLSPANDAQRALKRRIGEASDEIARTRLLMFADGEAAIPMPLLLILIFWLAVVFASYSLFVEPGRIVVAALLVFALSISSALFLVADLSQPFVGVMQIPKEQLRHMLAPLG
jgi:ABC-type multidrug transport system fused ATPase/permease subunit